MSTVTRIEWTEVTWIPTTGCDRTSPRCDHYYAVTLAKRLKAMGQAKYQLDCDPRASGPRFAVTMHEDALVESLRWRTPRKVFVNSMSDAGMPAEPAFGSPVIPMRRTPMRSAADGRIWGAAVAIAERLGWHFDRV
jgi:protein gp37